MRRFTLVITLPGSHQAHPFPISGWCRDMLVHDAAFILQRFARSRGVSVLALNYTVGA
jgi:hypothetical protein